GVLQTVAGNGSAGSSGDNGPATAASIQPRDVFCDWHGNVFATDNLRESVRRITAGQITTVAGGGDPISNASGSATSYRPLNLSRVAFSPAGEMYVAETNAILKVNGQTGDITRAVGDGRGNNLGDGGPAFSASIFHPAGMAFNAAGDLFV